MSVDERIANEILIENDHTVADEFGGRGLGHYFDQIVTTPDEVHQTVTDVTKNRPREGELAAATMPVSRSN